MQVVFFNRKPNGIFFSIEELFETLQEELKGRIDFKKFNVPYESTGLVNRIRNVLFAGHSKGGINHITGDVHYIGIFLPRRNTVLTIHDCGELDKQRGLKKLFLWLFWFYIPVKRLRYITVISEETKLHLLRYVKTNPRKIRVIPNCLIGKYTISTKLFNSKKPTILQVGTTPNKNILRIAEALKGIPCILKIVGIPSQEQLEAFAKNKIEFQYVSALSRVAIIEEYSNCDFVLFASLLEGFGLPIIEAQASGKALITSNISPMCDTAGIGACLVNPYDVHDIRNTVLRIINDSIYREKIITAGIENYKIYQPATMAKKYLELYNNMFDNGVSTIDFKS